MKKNMPKMREKHGVARKSLASSSSHSVFHMRAIRGAARVVLYPI
jgi:hypothetical protein